MESSRLRKKLDWIVVMSVPALFAGFLLPFLSAVSSEDQISIPYEAGQNISLPCWVPNNTVFLSVKWFKTNLGPKYVFFYRDGQPDLDNQHPAFTNQVALIDSEIKGGDVSVILKNATTEYSGVYVCQVKDLNKTNTNLTIVHLNVTDKSANYTGDTAGETDESEKTNGDSRGRTGLEAFVIISVICLCVWMFIQCINNRLYHSPVKTNFHQVV